MLPSLLALTLQTAPTVALSSKAVFLTRPLVSQRQGHCGEGGTGDVGQPLREQLCLRRPHCSPFCSPLALSIGTQAGASGAQPGSTFCLWAALLPHNTALGKEEALQTFSLLRGACWEARTPPNRLPSAHLVWPPQPMPSGGKGSRTQGSAQRGPKGSLPEKDLDLVILPFAANILAGGALALRHAPAKQEATGKNPLKVGPPPLS